MMIRSREIRQVPVSAAKSEVLMFIRLHAVCRFQLFMHGTCALPAVCHALATVETPRSPFGLGAAGAVLLAGCHDGAVASQTTALESLSP